MKTGGEKELYGVKTREEACVTETKCARRNSVGLGGMKQAGPELGQG